MTRRPAGSSDHRSSPADTSRRDRRAFTGSDTKDLSPLSPEFAWVDNFQRDWSYLRSARLCGRDGPRRKLSTQVNSGLEGYRLGRFYSRSAILPPTPVFTSTRPRRHEPNPDRHEPLTFVAHSNSAIRACPGRIAKHCANDQGGVVLQSLNV